MYDRVTVRVAGQTQAWWVRAAALLLLLGPQGVLLRPLPFRR